LHRSPGATLHGVVKNANSLIPKDRAFLPYAVAQGSRGSRGIIFTD
jgi:hypothetical protein